jgi:predicted component of viral defense system (DUF524 family)
MTSETVKILHAIVKSAVSSELKQYQKKLNSVINELNSIKQNLDLLTESQIQTRPVTSKKLKSKSNAVNPLLSELGITPFTEDESYMVENSEGEPHVQSILDVPVTNKNSNDPVAAVLNKINNTDYSKVLKIMENAANIERNRMSS